jgi:hypothetical protein
LAGLVTGAGSLARQRDLGRRRELLEHRLVTLQAVEAEIRPVDIVEQKERMLGLLPVRCSSAASFWRGSAF